MGIESVAKRESFQRGKQMYVEYVRLSINGWGLRYG